MPLPLPGRESRQAEDLRTLWRDLALDKEACVRHLDEGRPEGAFTGSGAASLDGCGRAVGALEQRELARKVF